VRGVINSKHRFFEVVEINEVLGRCWEMPGLDSIIDHSSSLLPPHLSPPFVVKTVKS